MGKARAAGFWMGRGGAGSSDDPIRGVDRHNGLHRCASAGSMVTLDQLAALDLLLWLTGSQRAACLERTNQSTIVRRAQAAEACFRVEIRRDSQGWGVDGDTELLALERVLHQRARLLGHRPLRLHSPFWTLRTGLGSLPPGWCANPAIPTAVCENPLELLRQRVIDAALLTPTQMPPSTEGLATFELVHRPIELMLFPQADRSEAFASFERLRARGELVLRSPSFLPHSCLQRCRAWFLELLEGTPMAAGRAHPRPAPFAAMHGCRPAPGAADELRVAFLTPEMQRVQGLPCHAADGFPPRPYVERLVVLAELAEEQPLLVLRRHLQGVMQPRSSTAATPSQRTPVPLYA